jgi:hypothetical protein
VDVHLTFSCSVRDRQTRLIVAVHRLSIRRKLLVQHGSSGCRDQSGGILMMIFFMGEVVEIQHGHADNDRRRSAHVAFSLEARGYQDRLLLVFVAFAAAFSYTRR